MLELITNNKKENNSPVAGHVTKGWSIAFYGIQWRTSQPIAQFITYFISFLLKFCSVLLPTRHVIIARDGQAYKTRQFVLLFFFGDFLSNANLGSLFKSNRNCFIHYIFKSNVISFSADKFHCFVTEAGWARTGHDIRQHHYIIWSHIIIYMVIVYTLP